MGRHSSSVEDTRVKRLHLVGLTGMARSTVNMRPVALFLIITTSLASAGDDDDDEDDDP